MVIQILASAMLRVASLKLSIIIEILQFLMKNSNPRLADRVVGILEEM